jgi:general secretion pathway protein A
MYGNFYGFREKPFEITPDSRFVYLSENHKEALAHLRYAMREGKGFSVITGEAGTGKTTLVHVLLRKLEGNIRTSYIFNPILDREDFLNYICDDLGITPGGMKTRGECLTALYNFLLDCFARNEKVFLIIDEAQSLASALLQEIRLLTNLETARHKLLHVILLGQLELDQILKQPRFRPLKQRINIHYQMQPLKFKETKEYILHRLKRAGARNLSIFDNGAIKEIYRYSSGIPRLINIVCDNALLAGFSADKKQITKSIIREVIGDLEGSGKSNGERRGLWLTLLLILLVLLGFITYYIFTMFFGGPIFTLWR